MSNGGGFLEVIRVLETIEDIYMSRDTRNWVTKRLFGL